MRPARTASSLWAIVGTSSSTARKWRWEMTNSEQSVSQIGGRRARAVVEQRQLADDGARPERGHLAVVALDGDGALEDDERLAPGLALVDQQGAGGHLDLVAGTGDALELLARAAGEQRHVAEVVEVCLLAGHGA